MSPRAKLPGENSSLISNAPVSKVTPRGPAEDCLTERLNPM
jgi:hypothetical protein